MFFNCPFLKVFLFFMKSDWPIHGLLSWRRSTAVATFKELELAGHPGSERRGGTCGRWQLDGISNACEGGLFGVQ